ncbi:MAG TPA: cytochrome b/b6 domain-containing protein [Gammaproteobacteria bacterium]|nr:cytochrome b/b6 domain-containing protein [Gammaproteobacteria bacterium]
MATAAEAFSARVKVWDLPLRLFHWLTVIAVAVAFLSSEEDSPLNHWHVIAGWSAGLLVVFRLVWGFVGGEHARFADFVKPSRVLSHVRELLHGHAEPTVGHNPLGAVSVLVLLMMIMATVYTGVVLMEEAHEAIAWTLLAFVGVHVVAVIAMSWLSRENLVSAMVTGTKPAARHPRARDARAPGLIAWLVAAIVLAGSVYAVRRYDPEAFTLRSAEKYEHQIKAERKAATSQNAAGG